MAALGRLSILVLSVLLLAGCTVTRYVPTVHYRDSLVMRLQRDSVYFHDSVFVNTHIKGDTVFRDRTKTTILYKDRLRTDTVVVNRTDTVSVVQEVEKSPHWYDKACRWMAVAELGALLAAGLMLMRKG